MKIKSARAEVPKLFRAMTHLNLCSWLYSGWLAGLKSEVASKSQKLLSDASVGHFEACRSQQHGSQAQHYPKEASEGSQCIIPASSITGLTYGMALIRSQTGTTAGRRANLATHCPGAHDPLVMTKPWGNTV